MKEEIIKLSFKKGFDSGMFNLPSLNNKRNYYLWLCLLQKWLREEHKIDVLIDSVGGIKGYYYSIQDVKTGDQIKDWSDKECIFEETLEKGLQESLKLI